MSLQFRYTCGLQDFMASLCLNLDTALNFYTAIKILVLCSFLHKHLIALHMRGLADDLLNKEKLLRKKTI
ncbi:hypothetical protein P8452_23799 [Trifolium repens]|nr:hypothetical protein P8452_23799 [Trifolium repens]